MWELGNSVSGVSSTPVRVLSNDLNYAMTTAASSTTYALTADGQAYCWGKWAFAIVWLACRGRWCTGCNEVGGAMQATCPTCSCMCMHCAVLVAYILVAPSAGRPTSALNPAHAGTGDQGLLTSYNVRVPTQMAAMPKLLQISAGFDHTCGEFANGVYGLLPRHGDQRARCTSHRQLTTPPHYDMQASQLPDGRCAGGEAAAGGFVDSLQLHLHTVQTPAAKSLTVAASLLPCRIHIK